MYVYSPILLDSQDLNIFYFHTNFNQSWDASPVTTIVPQVTGLRRWNGDADGYQLSFLAAGAAPGTKMVEKV